MTARAYGKCQAALKETSIKSRRIRLLRRIPAILWLASLAQGLCSDAFAHNAIDTWRSEIAAARIQAENDAAEAYKVAQNLQTTLPADATPADRALALNLLARLELYLAMTEASANHSREALALAKQNADRAGQAEAYLNIALNSVNQGRIDDLVDAAPQALEILDGVDRPDLLGEAMLRLAMMYRRLGQLDTSVTLCMQAMDIAQRGTDALALIYAHQCLGISYDMSERRQEALEHFSRMRELAREVSMKHLEADAVDGLAFALGNLDGWREVEALNRDVLTLYRAIGLPFKIGHGLFVLAHNLRMQGRTADTLPLLDEAVAIYQRYTNKIGLWWTLNARSENLQALGRPGEARADAEQAYALAQDIGLLLYRSESARRMAAISSAVADHKQAYRYSAEAADLADKLAREKSSVRMTELAQRYRSESKQRQIDELTLRERQSELEQRWLWTVLGGSIALLATTGLFLMRLRHSHRLLEASHRQLQASRQQIRQLNRELEQGVKSRSQALRQQAGYLQSLIDTLPFYVWLKDTECRYVSVNAGPSALNGLCDKEVLGKTAEDIWPDELGRRISEDDLEVMSTRRRKNFEVIVSDANGIPAWWEIDKAPVIDEDGSVLGSIGVARNITDRKRMEAELARSRNFLNDILDTIADPIFVKDRQHRWIHLNDACCRLFGHDREALIGKSDFDFFPEHEARIFWAGDEAVFESGREYTNEEEITNDKGEKRYIFTRKTVFTDGDDQPILVGIISDFTERRLMEEELARRERGYRTLAENAPDNIIRYDREGRVRYLNPVMAQTLGVELADLLGKIFNELPNIGDYHARMKQVLSSGEDCQFELCMPPDAGGPRVHLIRMVAEHNENGEFTGILAIGHDITEFKRYEAAREAALQEAVRLAKLRSEFLSHMSHELRTPLNGILGYAQLLERDSSIGERNAAALNVIRESGEHLLLLIEDILDLTRIENGRLELSIVDISLSKFLRIVAEIVGVKARQKGLEFHCDLAADLPESIRGDERRLRQVLLNLLDNAVKFTERGRVILRVGRVAPSRLIFVVKDTGIGIAETELETIFQPFEQTRNLRHRFGGTGLGLAISRQLARLMAGDIVVESRIGAGSSFRLELELPVANSVSASLPLGEGKFTDREWNDMLANDTEAGDFDERQAAPPLEEIQALYRLAQLGNMRDIVRQAERIAGLDPGYHAFASRLRELAAGYQSKAIMAFVAQHLPETASYDAAN